MSLSPRTLMSEMSKVDQIHALLGEDADPQLLLDVIEGETDALECVDALIEAILADELLAEDASARIKRLDARAQKNRAKLLLVLQDKLRLKKLQRPLATLSVSHTTPQPHVIAQNQLPAEYLMTIPDKTKLGAALRKGEQVPGAELSNSRPTLILRHD